MSLWVVLLLSVGVQAASVCIKQGPNGIDEPADFQALRDCQAKEKEDIAARIAKKTGRPMSAATQERVDDRQRAEVKDFMSRHTVGESDLDLASSRRSGEPAAKTAAKAASAGDAADQTQELAALKASMIQKSDGGKKGITPDMAGDMRKFLMDKQGSVSPDMEDLLGSTAKDGPNLTTETMKKLRAAGNAAKGQGLELGIDPKTEDALLHDDLEPAPGAPRPGTN
jgi:hypothetical protein